MALVSKKKAKEKAKPIAADKADMLPPKPKKEKKDKPEKKLGPKLVPSDKTPPPGKIGHNGGAIPALVDLMDETLALDERIKEINKAKRDIRNKAKTEFGVMSWNWSQEIAMRKLDRDVRIQRESGAVDLKNMLGYQIAMDLQPGTVARTEEELVDPGAPKDDIINRMG